MMGGGGGIGDAVKEVLCFSFSWEDFLVFVRGGSASGGLGERSCYT